MQFNLFKPDFYITIHEVIGKKELFIKHNSTGNYYFIEF